MNLLRIGLLMLLCAVKITAITIENKTPREITAQVRSGHSISDVMILSKQKKSFKVPNGARIYFRYGTGGYFADKSVLDKDYITVSGDGSTFSVGG